MGGNAESGRGRARADSNLVIINGGTTGTVIGGHGSGYLDGAARYNLVSISGGSVTSIVGGSATTTKGTADASFNAVLVNGGRVSGNIIGGLVYTSSTGQGSTARYNAITLVQGQIDGQVYGSAQTDSPGQVVSPLPAAATASTCWAGRARSGVWRPSSTSTWPCPTACAPGTPC